MATAPEIVGSVVCLRLDSFANIAGRILRQLALVQHVREIDGVLHADGSREGELLQDALLALNLELLRELVLRPLVHTGYVLEAGLEEQHQRRTRRLLARDHR